MTQYRPKILFSAYAFYPEFGGLEQQIYLLGQEYLKKGYQVDVLTEKTRPHLPSDENIDGLHVHRMPFHAHRNMWTYFDLGCHLFWFIFLNGRNYEYVILRAALTFYPLVFGVAKFFRLLPAPTFVTADTGGEADEIIIVKKWPFYRLMLYFFNQHTVLNSICEANYQHYLELGFRPSKLTKIGNGIDTRPYATLHFPQKVRRFLFLSRLIKSKGIRETLQAFEKVLSAHPDIELFIGGLGPEADGVKSFIKDHSLDKSIHYLGLISNDQKDHFYSLGECLIQPSYTEGFSLVYVEAAVHKRVIIATDVGDLKAMFGKSLYWCEKRSVDSLVEAMTAVLARSDFSNLTYDQVIPQLEIRKIADKILQAGGLPTTGRRV